MLSLHPVWLRTLIAWLCRIRKFVATHGDKPVNSQESWTYDLSFNNITSSNPRTKIIGWKCVQFCCMLWGQKETWNLWCSLLPPFPFHGLKIVQRQQLRSQPKASPRNVPGAQPVSVAVGVTERTATGWQLRLNERPHWDNPVCWQNSPPTKRTESSH